MPSINEQKKYDDVESVSLVPWKQYLIVATESVVAFYLATFCLAVFIVHRTSWGLQEIIMGVLYFFVIALCSKLLIERLSIAALFLVIPIAPLLALIIVISLIPIMEYL